MIVLRACSPRHKDKLDGMGAKKVGGRWNREGLPVNYTSDTKDTIRAELKNRGRDPEKLGHRFVQIEISDNLEILELTREMLEGSKWDLDDYEKDECPAQAIGSEILDANQYAVVKVPSVRSKGFNYLLNQTILNLKRMLRLSEMSLSPGNRILIKLKNLARDHLE